MTNTHHKSFTNHHIKHKHFLKQGFGNITPVLVLLLKQDLSRVEQGSASRGNDSSKTVEILKTCEW